MLFNNFDFSFKDDYICITMNQLPKSLANKLEERTQSNALRQLPLQKDRVDFSSNDYLGFSRNKSIFNQAHDYLVENDVIQNGATGSRLISGNFPLYDVVEEQIRQFHQSESALLYNSGYDANIGLFSALLQKGDVVLYDEIIHASIRDGVRMSLAKAYKFNHNNLQDLERKLARFCTNNTTVYVVTESIFSMDGDTPDLVGLTNLCDTYQAYLIVDEAHAIAVKGEQGEGLIQSLILSDKVFARIVTFGKGMGCHGAVVLGSRDLKSYLVNFSRSLIYTTGLSPHSVSTIKAAYDYLQTEAFAKEQNTLNDIIAFFKSEMVRLGLVERFVASDSAIQCCILSGNDNVKNAAAFLQENGFDVKPIMSPTVPSNKERLRFCLHSYNSVAEISEVLELLSKFVSQ